MRRPLLLASLLATLVLACGKRPEPLREFPDIPAYPGCRLQKRTPPDTTKPAETCFYRVERIDWVDVRKFYLKWMPGFDWTREEPVLGEKDPHLYYSKGSIMVAINPMSYAAQEQFAVFKYKKEGAPPTPSP